MAAGRSTDLLVIGGGPAGLATAIEARVAGFETLLIDRRRPPIDAACGEGLMPIGAERLRRLGVEIPDCDRAVIRGIRYLDGEVTAGARFTNGVGLGIRRPILHDALRRRAMDVGVQLRWGVSARRLGSNGVESDDGLLEARWLVAADGRLSNIRKLAGLEGRTPKRRRFGVRRHYAVPPWSEFVEVYWADSAEAYVTPIGPGAVGIALLSSESPIDFDRFLNRFPSLRSRLEGVVPISRDRGGGPFGQRPAAVVRDRLALVGDASGSLDPITGEGLSIAFAQAEALIRSLENGCIEDYAAAHRRIRRWPKLMTGLLLAIERHPKLRRRTISVLASNPYLFSHMVDVAASGRLPWSLPNRKLTRPPSRTTT
jgi:flavin-dependent dehydrogenase